MTEHGIELMGLSRKQMHFHAQILMVILFVKPHCSFLMSYGPISLLYLTASPYTPDYSCTAMTYHVPSNPSTVLRRAKTRPGEKCKHQGNPTFAFPRGPPFPHLLSRSDIRLEKNI